MRLPSLLAASCSLVAVTLVSGAASAQFFEEQGGNPLGATGDWTNYIRLNDLDGDGDLDIIEPNNGGLFSPPQAQPLRVWINDGGASFTESANTLFGTSGNLAIRVAAVGDIDGDGDLDVYLPKADGSADLLFVQGGDGSFTDEAASRLGGISSRSGGARFGDVDNDGDLDLFVADGYVGGTDTVHLYLNDGVGSFANADGQVPNGISAGVDPDDLDLIDVDRDYDLDLLINPHNQGKKTLWINDGSGNFTDGSAALPNNAGGPNFYGPSVCDVDGDGDLDIWSDNSGPNQTEQLMINNGSGTFTDETGSRVTGNPSADDNGVMCADVDNDGDLDAVVPSLGSQGERILINDGAGNFTYQSGAWPFNNDTTLWMDFGDLNGDGRLDAVTGQGEGTTRNKIYLANTTNNPVDDKAPKLLAEETLMASYDVSESPVMRFAVSDRAVTDSGPRVNAFAKVTVDGGTMEVAAWFMGGDLFRVVLPPQVGGSMVTVQPCATDRQGNEGCGQEQSYAVSGMAAASSSSGSGATAAGVGGAGATGASTGSNMGSGGDDPFLVDDEGCGCSTPGSSPRRAAGWLLALLALVPFVRRRGAKR